MLNRFQEGSGLAAKHRQVAHPAFRLLGQGSCRSRGAPGGISIVSERSCSAFHGGMQEPTLMEINDQPITFMKHVQP